MKSKIDKFHKVHLGKAKHTQEEWQKILGHCNVTDVQFFKATVDSMHILSKDKLTVQLDKIARYRNSEPDIEAEQPLDLVHCDVLAPTDPVVKEAHRYSISFLDYGETLTP